MNVFLIACPAFAGKALKTQRKQRDAKFACF